MTGSPRFRLYQPLPLSDFFLSVARTFGCRAPDVALNCRDFAIRSRRSNDRRFCATGLNRSRGRVLAVRGEQGNRSSRPPLPKRHSASPSSPRSARTAEEAIGRAVRAGCQLIARVQTMIPRSFRPGCAGCPCTSLVSVSRSPASSKKRICRVSSQAGFQAASTVVTTRSCSMVKRPV
jgi:hypothetical protein